MHRAVERLNVRGKAVTDQIFTRLAGEIQAGV
jgi:hypothetical protein